MEAAASVSRGLDLFEIKTLMRPGEPVPDSQSTRALLARLGRAGVSLGLVRLMVDRNLSETIIGLAVDAGLGASEVASAIRTDGTVDEAALRTLAVLLGTCRDS